MTTTFIPAREFREDPAATEEAAKDGPVLITEDGCTLNVFMNYEDYKALIQLARLPDLRQDEVMVAFAEPFELEAQQG